jgi:hypothetical protein
LRCAISFSRRAAFSALMASNSGVVLGCGCGCVAATFFWNINSGVEERECAFTETFHGDWFGVGRSGLQRFHE